MLQCGFVRENFSLAMALSLTPYERGDFAARLRLFTLLSKSEIPPRSVSRDKIEMERVKGIEPSSSAWKAVALPLSYTRAPAPPWWGK